MAVFSPVFPLELYTLKCHTLDTDSCIYALERFTARRGEPKEIWSDNGTNCVGARKELQRAIKDWNQDQIHEHVVKRDCLEV